MNQIYVDKLLKRMEVIARNCECAETIEGMRELITCGGYSKEDLERAFEIVADKKDWKAPIRAYVSSSDLAIVMEAIAFFTATVPTSCPVTLTEHFVESIGYRAGPAGDH